MRHRSIGMRINKAKTLDARRGIALNWVADWVKDHEITIRLIEKALQHGDVSTAGQHLGQLKELSSKRFSALPNIIEKLADEDIE